MKILEKFRHLKRIWNIKRWLRSQDIPSYKINEDYTVDVYDHVVIHGYKEMTGVLPIQFGRISGDFICSDLGLTSLKGCPHTVDGFFSCSNNNLKSLVGLPTKVRGHISYYRNENVAGLLHLLLVDGLSRACGDGTRLNNIINDHVQNGRDVFACQQELIDVGYPEYAQL